ncbi:hypothetical protein SPFL3102_03592 [Sporomusaceae bacterium FL31]|nr:hypothetical protein SPFL3101_00413 [Sporomusaceae bacterium FL31]GCE35741.1 hypothetical protein SPFL3102_03592 [Sporomusaceae bacterium]
MNWTQEQIERALKDFRVLLFIIWRMIGLPQPTPIQNDMARTLQHPPSDRFILEGFRGVAKSFITCAYVVWRLWLNPLLKVEIVSASKERADANAVFIKKIINTVPFLECLRLTDEDRKAGLKDTQNLFDVHGATPDISNSVKSVGITGQITGSRADILIADDVEIPNNSGTQKQRDALGEAVKEFDAILKPGGQIIYLGTPQTEMSLYNELQKRGYKVVIYPLLYPETPKEREDYGNNLAPFIAQKYDKDPEKWAGKSTEPGRFNEEEIAKRRLSYGRAGFSLQFLLNTNLTDAEKYPLKVSDLIIADLDHKETSLKWHWGKSPDLRLLDVPCVALKQDYFYRAFERSKELAPYTGTVMFIDPSGRGKDETAYAIVKYLNGYLFLMAVGGYTDGYSDDVLRSLALKARFYGVNQVVSEANFGDGMFTKILTPIFKEIYPCNIDEVKSSGQKEKRIIDTLEPVMQQHRLIVDAQVISEDFLMYEKDYQYSLFYQLTRISKEKNALGHDDRLDALTGAVAYWVEEMARSAELGVQERLEEQLEIWMDPDRGVLWIPEVAPKIKPGRQYFGRDSNILEGFFSGR